MPDSNIVTPPITTPVFKLTFGNVWNAWVARFGHSFWPLVGLAAIFNGILSVLGIIAVVTILLPTGIVDWFSAPSTPFPSFTSSAIVSMISVGVAFLVVIFIVSLWQQTALVIRAANDLPVGAVLRQSWFILGRYLKTALATALLVAVPMLLTIGFFVALFLTSYIRGQVVDMFGLFFGVGFIIFLLTGTWGIIAGIFTAFAGYLAIFGDRSAWVNIRTSWNLVRPYWWQVWLYPIPLSLIIGLTSSAFQAWPLIGPLAVVIVGTPAAVCFQYTIFRLTQAPASATPASPINGRNIS